MCVYFWWKGGAPLVVGVYVDDLLVTGTKREAVDAFFDELAVKSLGCAHKFLGMRVNYDEDAGYDLDQEITISAMLGEHGMELAHGVRASIGHEWNEEQEESAARLPADGSDGVITVTKSRSLVGLLWVATCSRPDIVFAVHKATRRALPTMADWKLAKRILMYLAGTKGLRLQMHGKRGANEPLEVVGYSDADFAADKEDPKSVTGGW
ncbi:Integrase catalytic core protein [Phytophthora cinnamomi]|uniref:Integrase catalytic core protein n=1 Tax=Phytophthora cinnamomi TaxID=4785 RepID=UPI00355A5749|nr:Integrase catalytic core protein [Phytophthora cinnamomi]